MSQYRKTPLWEEREEKKGGRVSVINEDRKDGRERADRGRKWEGPPFRVIGIGISIKHCICDQIGRIVVALVNCGKKGLD